MRRFLYAIALGAAMSACAFGVRSGSGADERGRKRAQPAPGGSTKPAPAARRTTSRFPRIRRTTASSTRWTVEDVGPSFVVYELPNEIPAPMKGGTLSGQYAVDGAKV
jgi:hypothetical protein